MSEVLDGYPEDLVAAAKLMQTIDLVGQACIGLMEQPESEVAIKPLSELYPFTILLNNPESPYASDYFASQRDADRIFLKQEGFSYAAIFRALNALHDTGTYLSFPFRGTTRIMVEERTKHKRSKALTITNPELIAEDMRRRRYPLNQVGYKAMLELVKRKQTLTKTDIQAIQQNLDNYPV
jgi:hypothetical protein